MQPKIELKKKSLTGMSRLGLWLLTSYISFLKGKVNSPLTLPPLLKGITGNIVLQQSDLHLLYYIRDGNNFMEEATSSSHASEIISKIGKCWSLSRFWLFVTPWTVAHQALCPLTSPGKNTGVGCHFLFQRIFWARDQTWVSCIAGRFFTAWATREAQ